MLRVPSEALPLVRALPTDELLSDQHPSSGALIGLREFDGQQRLILRLARRKNAKFGFTDMRPCFCGANVLLPKRNCPINFFWASVLKRTEPGSPLFPHFGGKNSNRILRKTMERIGIADAGVTPPIVPEGVPLPPY